MVSGGATADGSGVRAGRAAWEALHPWPSRKVEVAPGVGMAVVDEGPRRDPVLLCVHGNPSWSFLYRDVIRVRSGVQRVVAVDQVGMGRSDRPDAAVHPATLSRRIDDLEACWKALGEPVVDLMVHDWGGPVGLGLAVRHPGSVRRIVVTNTAVWPDLRMPRRIAVCRWPVVGALLVRGLNGFAGPATKLATMRRGGLPRVVAEGFLAPYRTWRERAAIHAFVKDIPVSPADPAWAPLEGVWRRLPVLAEKPVLLLWGARDFCFTLEAHRRFAEAWPHARSRVFTEAGHYVLEDAGEEALAEVADFLDGGG